MTNCKDCKFFRETSLGYGECRLLKYRFEDYVLYTKSEQGCSFGEEEKGE